MGELQGMVVSVGNSEGPALTSLRKYRPAFVLFVVSKDSRLTVEERVIPNLPSGYTPGSDILELSNPQSIADSYREVRERLNKLRSNIKISQEAKLALDITGGTKAMSVALALAGVAEGVETLVYVGGDTRDPGTGRVISGHEEVVVSVNPFGSDHQA